MSSIQWPGISCLHFWDEACWFLSLRVFGLLSSSLSKPPKSNISKTERQALKSLPDDDSIIILPADKGNVTVVMDRVEYSNKLADFIGNKDEDNSPKTLNDKNDRAVLHKLKLILFLKYKTWN